MIDQEHGILPIITLDNQTSWDDLLRVARPHLNTPGMERLRRAAGDSTRTIVVERHYIDRDYRDTFSNFYSKRFNTPDSRCIRIHFFGAELTRASLTDPALAQGAYLGYSVIRPTRPNCIGRTMIRPQARRTAQGPMSLCEENVTIQGTSLKVTAFPFISQDTDATVCAQAVLWMLMRYFSNRYPIYREVYPLEIGNLTRDYSVGRLFPTAGLYVWQMAEALRQVDFASVIYDRNEYAQDFNHLLYTYIESGIPVIAAFAGHVVVLCGHVSDYGGVATALPIGKSPYIVSSSFCHAFVGNDDNGIPYQLLRQVPKQVEWEEMRGAERSFSIGDIEQFVVPLPERVFLGAEHIGGLVNVILQDPQVGYRKLSPRLAERPLVLRHFLTTGKAFKTSMRDRADLGHPGVAEAYRNLPLPHFIWVCELSHSTLYPRAVLGEVIWDATRNPLEHRGVLAIHYPEVLMVDWGSALNDEPNLLSSALMNATEYPIYVHNLREVR